MTTGVQSNGSRKAKYDNYLKSPEWATLRGTRLRHDNHQCVLCGGEATEGHHVRYPAVFGTEDPIKDLVSLCRRCHRNHHVPLAVEELHREWQCGDLACCPVCDRRQASGRNLGAKEFCDPSLAAGEIERADNQCNRIFKRLQQGRATSSELSEIALKYTSRITDLRGRWHKAGFKFAVIRILSNGERVYGVSLKGVLLGEDRCPLS